jgi:hypothetical protein
MSDEKQDTVSDERLNQIGAGFLAEQREIEAIACELYDRRQSPAGGEGSAEPILLAGVANYLRTLGKNEMARLVDEAVAALKPFEDAGGTARLPTAQSPAPALTSDMREALEAGAASLELEADCTAGDNYKHRAGKKRVAAALLRSLAALPSRETGVGQALVTENAALKARLSEFESTAKAMILGDMTPDYIGLNINKHLWDQLQVLVWPDGCAAISAPSTQAECETDDWQPIATVPKDGREVLLNRLGSKRVYTGCWATAGESGFIRDTHGQQRDPTYWKPLPVAPDCNGTGKAQDKREATFSTLPTRRTSRQPL